LSSHAPASIDRPPSRTGSASSNRTARSSRSENVLIELSFSFDRRGKKLIPIDLNTKSDGLVSYLNSRIPKDKQLDSSVHQIEIASLRENAPEPIASHLSDLDYSWDVMVEFMRDNRNAGKKVDFRFVIT